MSGQTRLLLDKSIVLRHGGPQHAAVSGAGAGVGCAWGGRSGSPMRLSPNLRMRPWESAQTLTFQVLERRSNRLRNEQIEEVLDFIGSAERGDRSEKRAQSFE